MIRLPLIATVFVALVFTGVVDGLWSDRWGQAVDLPAAWEKVNHVPLRLGAWEGQVVENDESITNVIGPMALRHYVNPSTGGAVDLAARGWSAARSIPAGYVGDGSDAVSAVRYLLAAEARYVNGAKLHLSRGRGG